MNYNQKAFIIGMIGDFLLQQIVKYHPKGDFAGLKSYFKIHGSFESLLILTNGVFPTNCVASFAIFIFLSFLYIIY